jgi:hypothetical protein
MASLGPEDVTYEIWERSANGTLTRRHHGNREFPDPGTAGSLAAGYNATERENARQERRPINRTFIVIKATTTFEEI